MIALYAPRSGPQAATTADLERGIRIALAEERDAGDDTQLVVIDSAASPDDVELALGELHTYDKLRALIRVDTAGHLPKELAHVPVVAPLEHDADGTAYQASGSEVGEAVAVAHLAADLSWNRVVVVDDGAHSSDMLAWTVDVWIPQYALGARTTDVALTPGASSFAPEIAQIRKAKSDAVVVVATDPHDVEHLIVEARAAGVTTPFLACSTLDDLASPVDPALDGTYQVSRFVIDDPDSKAFVQRYTSMYRRDPAVAAALGHDAAVLAVEGPRRVAIASRRSRSGSMTRVSFVAGHLQWEPGMYWPFVVEGMAIARIVNGVRQFVRRDP